MLQYHMIEELREAAESSNKDEVSMKVFNENNHESTPSCHGWIIEGGYISSRCTTLNEVPPELMQSFHASAEKAIALPINALVLPVKCLVQICVIVYHVETMRICYCK